MHIAYKLSSIVADVDVIAEINEQDEGQRTDCITRHARVQVEPLRARHGISMLEEHPSLVCIALGNIPQLLVGQGVFAGSILIGGIDRH